MATSSNRPLRSLLQTTWVCFCEMQHPLSFTPWQFLCTVRREGAVFSEAQQLCGLTQGPQPDHKRKNTAGTRAVNPRVRETIITAHWSQASVMNTLTVFDLHNQSCLGFTNHILEGNYDVFLSKWLMGTNYFQIGPTLMRSCPLKVFLPLICSECLTAWLQGNETFSGSFAWSAVCPRRGLVEEGSVNVMQQLGIVCCVGVQKANVMAESLADFDNVD